MTPPMIGSMVVEVVEELDDPTFDVELGELLELLDGTLEEVGALLEELVPS